MSPHAKEFWAKVRANPLFEDLRNEIKKSRPVVPAYTPCQTEEELFSLLERIRFESGRQAGFDKVYLLLTGEKGNE